MKEISLPYHLIIPTIISILILGILFYKRKKLFINDKNKVFWISVILFFCIYLLIVGNATYTHYSTNILLQSFDLNKDGNFNTAEITPEFNIAMRNVISDTGRNFSFITGLLFSGIITSFVYVIGTKINQYKNNKL
ncbi:hypothetical protein MPF19_09590 [Polaribacter sp. Z014]|uniref:hypothetical protein n=1 Tax=unclassified Polaribacter TaxID=196858 RepID=UPI00193AEDE2|nr:MULTISPECIES: hypothetical protein [unclassified Polaribacter]MCL7763665.1 hypothetical protein [Polaribacter sp. Z014]QVY65332.1 hypothetical protein JOP69_16545 [Polaribacter sp. Q13]